MHRPFMSLIMVKHVVFFLLLSVVINSIALSSDKNQPIQVQAGSADINQQTHQGIYKNNVQLVQGTTHIEAYEAITTGDNTNQLVLAVIKGTKDKPAHYQTMTEANKPPLHAYADTMKYYPKRHVIELIGNASITQGNNAFKAAKITLNIQTHHIVSQSDNTQQTIITFYPEKHV